MPAGKKIRERIRKHAECVRLRVAAERVSCSLGDGCESELELGDVWWAAVQCGGLLCCAVLAPPHASACCSGSSWRFQCPASTRTLVRRGGCARQREHFMIGADGG